MQSGITKQWNHFTALGNTEEVICMFSVSDSFNLFYVWHSGLFIHTTEAN